MTFNYNCVEDMGFIIILCWSEIDIIVSYFMLEGDQIASRVSNSKWSRKSAGCYNTSTHP